MDRSREGLSRLLGSRVGLVGSADELHGCVVCLGTSDVTKCSKWTSSI